MSVKANSHVGGKSAGNGGASVIGAGGASVAGGGTKHHRRARRNSRPGSGIDRGGDPTTADGAGGVSVTGGGDKSTTREYAGTAASHSQATTGQRRGDHILLCPSRVLYENTYRVEPQVKHGAAVADQGRVGGFTGFLCAGADWTPWQPGTCQVGRLVRRPGGPQCCMREWNGGGGPGPLAREGGLYSRNYLQGPRVPTIAS